MLNTTLGASQHCFYHPQRKETYLSWSLVTSTIQITNLTFYTYCKVLLAGDIYPKPGPTQCSSASFSVPID